MNCEPNDLAIVNKATGTGLDHRIIETHLLGRIVTVGASSYKDEKGTDQWPLTEPIVIQNFLCPCGDPGCPRLFTAILDCLPDEILKPLRDKKGEDEAERLARERKGQQMKAALVGHTFTTIIPDEIEEK